MLTLALATRLRRGSRPACPRLSTGVAIEPYETYVTESGVCLEPVAFASPIVLYCPSQDGNQVRVEPGAATMYKVLTPVVVHNVHVWQRGLLLSEICLIDFESCQHCLA